MPPSVRALCAALVFIYPGWLGLYAMAAASSDMRARARVLSGSLATAPAGAERDYLFLRQVSRCLRPGDRLVLVKDPLSELIDLSIPLLAGGWFGPTDVLFAVPPPGEVTRWVHQRVTDQASVDALTATLERLRRSPEDFARIVDQATVAVAWSSDWRPGAGLPLLVAAPDLAAWRLR